MGEQVNSVRHLSVAGTLLVCGADVLIANRLRADAFARPAPAAEISDAEERKEPRLVWTRRAGAAWMHETIMLDGRSVAEMASSWWATTFLRP